MTDEYLNSLLEERERYFQILNKGILFDDTSFNDE